MRMLCCPRRNSQVIEPRGRVEHGQRAHGDDLDVDEAPDALTSNQLLGVRLSIGVVSTRTGRVSCAALLSRAQAKCDEAREQGGNRVVA